MDNSVGLDGILGWDCKVAVRLHGKKIIASVGVYCAGPGSKRAGHGGQSNRAYRYWTPCFIYDRVVSNDGLTPTLGSPRKFQPGVRAS